MLARDPELFHWQHFDAKRDRYQFALAKADTGGIAGALGYIRDDTFDATASRSAPVGAIWLAIWRVHPAVRVPGLGLKLRDLIEQEERPAVMAAMGLNARTVPLYKAFRYEVGRVQQYYMVRNDVQEPRLVDGLARTTSDAPSDARKCLVQVTPADLGRFEPLLRTQHAHRMPRKSRAYLHGRYAVHPRYRYGFHAIMEADHAHGLLVTRAANANGTNAIRIVDVVGEPAALAGLSEELQSLLRSANAEYLDLWNFGWSEDTFARAGLLRLDPEGTTIVPNYFEPFVRKNVTIHVAYKALPGFTYVAFRGDADQDRPSQ